MADKQLTVSSGETSWERVKAAQASKLMTLAPPWALWPVIGGIGTALHALFGHGTAAAWSAIGLTLGAVLLTTVTFLVAHERGFLGRGSATCTTAAVSMWVDACSVAGFTQPVILYFWLAGGLVLAAAWNIRTAIRSKQGAHGITDALSFLFDANKDKASLSGARMATLEAGERKIEAAMALPAGEKTVGDVQKKTEHIEGAMGLPPGAMTVSPNLDRADLAHVTISDPRVLRTPLPWPGPSRPDASVAELLRTGVFQDGTDAELYLVGDHLQVMGRTGSAKSLGAGWNLLAELFSRPDVAVLAADLSKGEQTLGPCREGLHRFETAKEGATALIRDVYGQIKPRTDWLAARGFTAWEPGCGLTYWVVWFEEAAKTFAQISDKDEELFKEIVKEIRSAGGTVVLSLQRADWTQMSTLVRGQLSKMCFGVESSADASFGISEAQDEAGCRPELWGKRYPGMAYLDATGVDEGHLAMPLRTFLWDKSGDQMRAHCSRFPAAAKQMDEFTEAITRGRVGQAAPAGTPTGVTEDEDERDERDDQGDEEWTPTVATEDPDPSIRTTLDDPIEDDPDDAEFTFTRPAQRLTSAETRTAILSQLAAWMDEGKEDFSTKDLAPIWTAAGTSRPTVQRILAKLRDEDGVIGYDETSQRHTLLQRPGAVPERVPV
ncbi:hypothetical protein [Actinomadura fibrosa]|uniref:Uncharacterized protein n=1 Tax=Actinomadura fibrosa TaxID=111802 RepID=A0ABW2XNN9_9ACTN|nr:hypothetical protein [Actinomadura fibrosa]